MPTFKLGKLHRPKEGLSLSLKRGLGWQDSSPNIYDSAKMISGNNCESYFACRIFTQVLIKDFLLMHAHNGG